MTPFAVWKKIEEAIDKIKEAHNGTSNQNLKDMLNNVITHLVAARAIVKPTNSASQGAHEAGD